MLMAKKQKTDGPRKYFDDQFDDEEVLLVFRKHPVVMRKGLIFGMAAWLVGPIYVMVLSLLRPENPPSMALFGLCLLGSIVLGILIFMPWYISWYFSVFIVTNQRLLQITQKGLFNRSVVDMSLQQIQMINYQVAGLQETLLGFGTIMMQTFVGDLVIRDVHHPAKIQKKLIGILREQGIAATQFASVQSGTPLDDEEAQEA